MRISAKADYAVRAMAELAAGGGTKPMKADQISHAQDIPLKFLLNILSELKRFGLVRSTRGAVGGFQLGRPPEEITLADVIRAVEGPLANVHEVRPDEITYPGPAESLRDVWIAVRASLRQVLEHVTVADLASGSLPRSIKEIIRDPEAWSPR